MKNEKQVAIKELTEIVKFTPFITKYTDINPKGGIVHRLNNKSTVSGSKPKSFTTEDIVKITEGLVQLSNYLETTIKVLQKEEADEV